MSSKMAVLLASSAEPIDIIAQASQSGGVVLAVLLLLIAMSLICWFVIGLKGVVISGAMRQSARFTEEFRQASRLSELYKESEFMPDSPARTMFRAGYEELNRILLESSGQASRPSGDGPAARPKTSTGAFENIERSVRHAASKSRSKLETFVGFLATVGSAAPFIGLFGTVWGIMNAFHGIDPDEPILETVTPHIAEALLATAVGLLAAIPAVMAYNWLLGRLDQLDITLSEFSTDFLNILRRNFFS